ncbi:DUF1501 domain-containing protein [Phormidesmis priestleyi]|uniref:DUF1501 domain-containing protein n=1 Tax=Phormidesmis priestleyi TaxID=268141 RepID=UPI00083B44B5|nr:DUF1501 domain-containing protein [Phormidesmis priestleyi]
MKRRHFLQTGIASALTLISVGTHGWFARTPAETMTASTRNPKRLIVIFLRGAVDGLNVVVPYREAAYYQARPTISIPQPGQNGGALDLDGQFGLHPALASILPLWQQGSLAFVHGSGSPDPTRSHFDAQDNMERGTPGMPTIHDGWMNRLLDSLSGHNPIQAVNVGDVTPKILSGRVPVATLALGRGAARPISLDQPQVGNVFDRLYRGNNRLSQAYREGRAARKALLADLDTEMKMANNGAPLPYGFASDAQRLAQIMNKDPRVALAFMAVGGWDTHVNQGASQGQLARNLEQLGKGLTTLQTTLGSTYAETTILVMSEFGRTVHENGDGGTDHGHGNVMWLLGGGVRGGKIYSEWRGLASDQLYQERDLAVTTDFRDVIAAVLERHLQLPDQKLSQILPNYQPPQRTLSVYG